MNGPGQRLLLQLVLCAVFLPGWSPRSAAQDSGLDPLLFVPFDEGPIQEVESRSIEIYRIPLSYRVRSLDSHPWGLRIMFPVSLASYRITALTDIDEFVTGLEAASIIPGVEFDVPVGDRWQLKPFAEVGIGRGSAGGETEIQFGSGIRARGDYSTGRLGVTLGGAAAYKRPSTSRARYDGYSRIEVGIDAQLPLGFDVGARSARGGLYGIVRQFHDLDFERVGEKPIELNRQYEAGLSFSTEPPLRVSKAKLAWIGLGYQFGKIVKGVRLYFSFPF